MVMYAWKVIEWFEKIPNKDKAKFINFDIESFYPSITENLTDDAIEWVRLNGIPVSQEEVKIIKQSRKTLLFSNNSPWIKKKGADFDVPMGCYDGAELCELVGAFLLYKIKSANVIEGGEVGLYRDDGLGVIYDVPGPQIEKMTQKLRDVFKEYELGITVDAGLTSVNFLDVTLDLRRNFYKPYMKPNSLPVYVHSKSNHPQNILDEIPIMINKRLSDLSKNETLFDESKHPYEEALAKSGYDVKLKYSPNKKDGEQTERKNRSRNINWYNPPYSQSVVTNLGKKFFQIIDKHFPPGSPLSKIFNRHTVKLSYSCTKNIGDIISGHNKKILVPPKKDFGCNCRKKEECPLDGQCKTPNVVYKATVTNSVNEDEKIYIGMTENFKKRYANHKKSFSSKRYKNETELSSYYHTFDNPKDVKVKFEIVRSTSSKPKYGFCGLCCSEKLVIYNCIKDKNLLNSKFPLVSHCPHQKSTLLSDSELVYGRFNRIVAEK